MLIAERPNDLRFCCGAVPKPPQIPKNKDILRRLRRSQPRQQQALVRHRV